MNIRLQKYKKNRLAGMNIYNAARAAGYSETYAKGKPHRIEKSVKVGMADAFERAGLTDKAIIEHALEGLVATKATPGMRVKMGGEEDGVSATVSHEPDWTARHKYFETILKMTDKLKDKLDVNLNKTERILIVRYDGSKAQEVARSVHIQSEAVSGAMVSMGDRQEHEPDISGHVIQRANP